jgi:hypothetical protein
MPASAKPPIEFRPTGPKVPPHRGRRRRLIDGTSYVIEFPNSDDPRGGAEFMALRYKRGRWHSPNDGDMGPIDFALADYKVVGVAPVGAWGQLPTPPKPTKRQKQGSRKLPLAPSHFIQVMLFKRFLRSRPFASEAGTPIDWAAAAARFRAERKR